MVDSGNDRNGRLEEYGNELDRLSAALEAIPKFGLDCNYSPCSKEEEALNLSAKLINPPNPSWLDDDADESIDIDEEALEKENSWLLDDAAPPSVKEIMIDPEDLSSIDVSPMVKPVDEFSQVFEERKKRLLLMPHNTNTYVKSKKSSLTPPKPASPAVAGSPKTRRRLTTTIEPSPALIPALEHLSRTNNKSLYLGEETRWEDGAPEGEAPAAQPAATRPNIPASLIKRLEELKALNTSVNRGNNTATVPKFRPGPMNPRHTGDVGRGDPADPMSVSQLMREIPDWESEEPESFLSLGDTSLMHIGDRMSDIDLAHLKDFISENNARMTLGGVVIPQNRVALEQFVGLDKTFAEDRRLTLGGALLPTNVGAPDLISLRNVEDDTFVQLDSTFDADEGLNPGFADENCNNAANTNGFKAYSSQLFDQTFPKNSDNILDGTFNLRNGIELNPVASQACDSPAETLNGTFSPFDPLQNHTFMQQQQQNLTFTPPDQQVVPKNADLTFTPSETQAMLGKSYVKQTESSFVSSEVTINGEKELNTTQKSHYSTATYTRPTARMSPAKSGLPRRRGLSSEDLARSPARSDGSTTPVDGRPALGTYTRNSPVTVMGTYTRNSPVERCGSEDERMSTTSDRSQESVEDLVERFKQTVGKEKRSVSTPRNSGAIMPDDWLMSPISRHQSMSAASSCESIGRGSRLAGQGPAPFKPALIRPTDNFKRPLMKKTEAPPPKPAPAGPPGPARLTATKPASGLPQPAGRVPASKIPSSRLSAIPRPGAGRPSLVKKS